MILQEDLPTKFDKAYSLVNYGDLKVGDDIWIVKVMRTTSLGPAIFKVVSFEDNTDKIHYLYGHEID